MDNRAIQIIEDYVKERVHRPFVVYTVWKVKVLQNWKYLLSTDLPDGMYYELTFNGDKHEWYLDAYRKQENRVIKEDVQ